MIPKGTMVIPLQWAIHMDPSRWGDPQEFRPERFIGEDGAVLRPDGFIPFQTGELLCTHCTYGPEEKKNANKIRSR